MTGGTLAPLGNDNPRAPETRIVRRPVLEMGASGIGLDGVGVVEREPGWGGVELREFVPEEPSSLIFLVIFHDMIGGSGWSEENSEWLR